MALLQLLERIEADKLIKLEACVNNHFDDISATIAAAEAAILGMAGLQAMRVKKPRRGASGQEVQNPQDVAGTESQDLPAAALPPAGKRKAAAPTRDSKRGRKQADEAVPTADPQPSTADAAEAMDHSSPAAPAAAATRVSRQARTRQQTQTAAPTTRQTRTRARTAKQQQQPEATAAQVEHVPEIVADAAQPDIQQPAAAHDAAARQEPQHEQQQQEQEPKHAAGTATARNQQQPAAASPRRSSGILLPTFQAPAEAADTPTFGGGRSKQQQEAAPPAAAPDNADAATAAATPKAPVQEQPPAAADVAASPEQVLAASPIAGLVHHDDKPPQDVTEQGSQCAGAAEHQQEPAHLSSDSLPGRSQQSPARLAADTSSAMAKVRNIIQTFELKASSQDGSSKTVAGGTALPGLAIKMKTPGRSRLSSQKRASSLAFAVQQQEQHLQAEQVQHVQAERVEHKADADASPAPASAAAQAEPAAEQELCTPGDVQAPAAEEIQQHVATKIPAHSTQVPAAEVLAGAEQHLDSADKAASRDASGLQQQEEEAEEVVQPTPPDAQEDRAAELKQEEEEQEEEAAAHVAAEPDAEAVSSQEEAAAEAAGAAPAAGNSSEPDSQPQGSNLVSALRSFLSFMPAKKAPSPIAAGKKPVKVKALEQAQAARKADEARQAEKARLKNEAAHKQKADTAGPAAGHKAAAADGELHAAGRVAAGAAAAKAAAATVAKPAAAAGADDARRRQDKHAAAAAAAAAAAGGAVHRQGDKQNDRTNYEERQRRAEAKRREEEAKRKAELEERQRLREERAKKAGVAAKLPAKPAAGGDGLRAKGAASRVAKDDETGPLPTAAAGKLKAPEAARELPVHASPAVQLKVMAPVHSEAPAAAGASNSAAQPKQLSKLMSGPQRTPMVAAPMSEQDKHNIEKLVSSPYVNHTQHKTPMAAKTGKPGAVASYEISPYRSDSEDDSPGRPRKAIPDWARGVNLMDALRRQQRIDPDKIFGSKDNTCNLDNVFEYQGKALPTVPGKRNFRKRTSSGNWLDDRVTWKEEMAYKKAMGYL